MILEAFDSMTRQWIPTRPSQAYSKHLQPHQPCQLTVLPAMWPTSKAPSAPEGGKMFFPEETQIILMALIGHLLSVTSVTPPSPTTVLCLLILALLWGCWWNPCSASGESPGTAPHWDLSLCTAAHDPTASPGLIYLIHLFFTNNF